MLFGSCSLSHYIILLCTLVALTIYYQSQFQLQSQLLTSGAVKDEQNKYFHQSEIKKIQQIEQTLADIIQAPPAHTRTASQSQIDSTTDTHTHTDTDTDSSDSSEPSRSPSSLIASSHPLLENWISYQHSLNGTDNDADGQVSTPAWINSQSMTIDCPYQLEREPLDPKTCTIIPSSSSSSSPPNDGLNIIYTITVDSNQFGGRIRVTHEQCEQKPVDLKDIQPEAAEYTKWIQKLFSIDTIELRLYGPEVQYVPFIPIWKMDTAIDCTYEARYSVSIPGYYDLYVILAYSHYYGYRFHPTGFPRPANTPLLHMFTHIDAGDERMNQYVHSQPTVLPTIPTDQPLPMDSFDSNSLNFTYHFAQIFKSPLLAPPSGRWVRNDVFKGEIHSSLQFVNSIPKSSITFAPSSYPPPTPIPVEIEKHEQLASVLQSHYRGVFFNTSEYYPLWNYQHFTLNPLANINNYQWISYEPYSVPSTEQHYNSKTCLSSDRVLITGDSQMRCTFNTWVHAFQDDPSFKARKQGFNIESSTECVQSAHSTSNDKDSIVPHTSCYDPNAFPEIDAFFRIATPDHYQIVFMNFGHHPASVDTTFKDYFEKLFKGFDRIFRDLPNRKIPFPQLLVWVQSYLLPRRLDRWPYSHGREHRVSPILGMYNAVARYVMKLFHIPIIETSFQASMPFIDATFDDAHPTEAIMNPVVADMYRMFEQLNCEDFH